MKARIAGPLVTKLGLITTPPGLPCTICANTCEVLAWGFLVNAERVATICTSCAARYLYGAER